MLALGFIFEGVDESDAQTSATGAACARLAEVVQVWARGPWAAYAAGRNPQRVLRFSVTLRGARNEEFETADVTLVTDAQLPAQFVDIALTVGGAAMVAALRAVLAAKGSMTMVTRALFLSAHDAAERFLADELARGEHRASLGFAPKLQAMKDANLGHMRQFKERSALGVSSQVLLLPPDQKRILYSKLAEARRIRLRIEKHQSELEERDRKDGATPAARTKARARDQYRRLRYELDAAPQRTQIAAFGVLQQEIFELYPPALAIIGQVDADLDGWQPTETAPPGLKLRMGRVEEKYDTLLWDALVAQAGAVAWLEKSLQARSVPVWSAAYFRLDADARREAGGVFGHVQGALLAPAPGALELAKRMVRDGPLLGTFSFLSSRAGALQENHVLASEPALDALVDDAYANPSKGLEAALFSIFQIDLVREQRIRADAERDRAVTWHRLEVTLALAGLLVGLVSLPFGAGEAILPASLGWLGTLLAVTLVFSAVVMLVRTLIMVLDAALRADAQLQDRLIALGQENPEALEELAVFLTRRRELAATLAKAVVIELIELAAQKMLPPLAFALDVRDHLQTMDGLAESIELAVDPDAQ